VSELKNGADDPRVIATTIVVNHGTNADYGTIAEVTLTAIDADRGYLTDDAHVMIAEVERLVRGANVVVCWPGKDECDCLCCTR